MLLSASCYYCLQPRCIASFAGECSEERWRRLNTDDIAKAEQQINTNGVQHCYSDVICHRHYVRFIQQPLPISCVVPSCTKPIKKCNSRLICNEDVCRKLKIQPGWIHDTVSNVDIAVRLSVQWMEMYVYRCQWLIPVDLPCIQCLQLDGCLYAFSVVNISHVYPHQPNHLLHHHYLCLWILVLITLLLWVSTTYITHWLCLYGCMQGNDIRNGE